MGHLRHGLGCRPVMMLALEHLGGCGPCSQRERPLQKCAPVTHVLFSFWRFGSDVEFSDAGVEFSPKIEIALATPVSDGRGAGSAQLDAENGWGRTVGRALFLWRESRATVLLDQNECGRTR